MAKDKEKEEALKLQIGQEQIVHMKVAAQIIQHLSKGIYSNPANCIKELISNSFDADASEVIVRAKPEFDTFSITDDGDGMNYVDFSTKFLWISRSDKRDKRENTLKFKRPIIGKIGIGFISVSEICDKMTVISSKRGENFKFQAEIDFEKFKKTVHQKKDFYEISQVKLTNLEEEKNSHYTIILLSGLSKDFKDLLEDKDIHEAGIKIATFEGRKFEGIIEEIEKKYLDSSKDIGGYWRLVLDVANTVPVPYLKEGPIKVKNPNWFKQESKSISNLKNTIHKLKFLVDFDGIIIKKPILLPGEKDIFDKKESYDLYYFEEEFNDFPDGSKLKFRGYIYNQERQIFPPHLRGIIIRIKNTSIGGSDPDFLSYPYAEKLFLPWVFGEIYIDEGLEEAMNINRSSFIITHPHFRKLKNYLHTKLHAEVFPRCRERYTERKEETEVTEKKSREENIKVYLKDVFNKNFQIKPLDKTGKFPVDIDIEKKEVLVFKGHPIFKKKKKKEKDLLEEVLILFETSYHNANGDLSKLKDYFINSLSEWTNLKK
ncbi:MAG: ATP-binding protein [Candidatus Omnitrophica bacterium]|nr:ATP-binding protein [Candidatus Omnitrophota bacterium]